MKENKVFFMTQAALIAAIYVVLCMVFAPISFGQVQLRIAEALVVLPCFTKAAVPGLFIGCLISNLLGGSVLLDVVFGSLATLIGAMGSWYFRKNKYVLLLCPIISNVLIVPLVLYYGYGVLLPIPVMMVTVGIGEVISVVGFGSVLMKALDKYKHVIFHSKKMGC